MPFPSTKATFTNKVDFRDVIFAEHVNTLQNEIVTLHATLGSGTEYPAQPLGILNSIYGESTTAWSNTGTFSDLNARLNNIERGLINGVDLAPYFRKAGGALNDTTSSVSLVTKSAVSNTSVDQIQTKTSASVNGFRVDWNAIPYYQTYRLLDTRDETDIYDYIDTQLANFVNINPLLIAGM